MRVVICEDNIGQQQMIFSRLKNYSMMNYPSVDFVLVASSAELVLAFIENDKADCYFLDIRLGDGQNGLQLAADIRKKDVLASIIFVTDYSEGLNLTFKYKVAALDFIVKETTSRFSEQLIEAFESSIKRYEQLGQMETTNYFQIKMGELIKNIPYEEIYYFATSENIHKLHLSEKNGVYEFYGKLKDIEERYSHFFRCHKSCVINLQHVSQLHKKDRNVEMVNGVTCPVSIRAMKNLERKLGELFK